MFPPSLLAKLFVRGSLRNTENGFVMRLKNIIDSGTISGAGPLVVDETSYAPADYFIKVGEKETNGADISRANSVLLRAYTEAQIRVVGQQLPAGEHKVTFTFLTSEAGKLSFSISEPLTE